MSTPHHRRPNPLTAILGRPASSFTVEQLDALPANTAFAHRRNEPFTRLGALWCLDGRAELSLTSSELRATECVCIAVGEPDGVPADIVFDLVIPRPTKALAQIAADVEIEGVKRPVANVRAMLDAASEALDEWVATGSEEAHGLAVTLMHSATTALRAAR